MKRNKPLRRTPMKRGSSQLKRTPLHSMSAKRKSQLVVYRGAKKIAFLELAAAQGRPGSTPHCERCVKEEVDHPRCAVDWHHWHPTGQGGAFLQDTMFCLCRTCHDEIHQNPSQARMEGWLKP